MDGTILQRRPGPPHYRRRGVHRKELLPAPSGLTVGTGCPDRPTLTTRPAAKRSVFGSRRRVLAALKQIDNFLGVFVRR